MPTQTVVDIPQEEHAQRLAARRRARSGYVLALHMLLGSAAGRPPTDLAAVLFGSRSSVSRTVRAYRAGTLGLKPDADGRLRPPIRTPRLVPTLRRSRLALLKAPPRASGGCRTRGSGATLAATLHTQRGSTVSAATLRRWVHEGGWGWKRAQRVAKDDAPQRVDRRARLRLVYAQLRLREALVFAAARDSHRWPKGGYAWRPQGRPLAVMTPGQHQQHSFAGALDLTTGTRHHGLGPRTTNALCRHRLPQLAARSPADCSPRLSVVVDHDQLQTAQAVEPWLATHPRGTLRLLPTSGPRATPLARACGDVHECCTRPQQRKR